MHATHAGLAQYRRGPVTRRTSGGRLAGWRSRAPLRLLALAPLTPALALLTPVWHHARVNTPFEAENSVVGAPATGKLTTVGLVVCAVGVPLVVYLSRDSVIDSQANKALISWLLVVGGACLALFGLAQAKWPWCRKEAVGFRGLFAVLATVLLALSDPAGQHPAGELLAWLLTAAAFAFLAMIYSKVVTSEADAKHAQILSAVRVPIEADHDRPADSAVFSGGQVLMIVLALLFFRRRK